MKAPFPSGYALFWCLCGLGAAVLRAAEPGVKPDQMPLRTVWADEVVSTNVLGEYPRPTMVRDAWLNLNGLWDLSVSARPGIAPSYDRKILVPFPVESALSGIQRPVVPQQTLRYQRTFRVPSAWRGMRLLLHFEAVNWEARVELNGKELGTHRGGYDRFSFDLTDALATSLEQTLTVTVKNPTDTGTQPRGKQTLNPSGIWFSPSSGIWQTVWLEPVPETSVASLNLQPDIDNASVRVRAQIRGAVEGVKVEVVAYDGTREVGRATGPANEPFQLRVPEPKLWSPENPFLYQLKLALVRNGKPLDEVASYFGMRKISVVKDAAGHPRIALNGHPYFLLGVLDHGYWPEGIYTAPTDKALRSDIEAIRRLGLNTSRKHVKVEPERWYYWCDKLGVLVWQDMPSAGGFTLPKTEAGARPPEIARQFETELQRMVEQHVNHPSIVLWVAFNEGWGQYDTARIVGAIKGWDPSRLVIGASGWNDFKVGDVQSLHKYPGPAIPTEWDGRAVVAGECGGLAQSTSNHVWRAHHSWGFRYFPTPERLQAAYTELMAGIALGQKQGLSGAIITELTDTESEVDGFMTYDRKVTKFNPASQGAKVAGRAAYVESNGDQPALGMGNN